MPGEGAMMEGGMSSKGRGGFDNPEKNFGGPGGRSQPGSRLIDTSALDGIAPLPKSPLELPPATTYYQIDVRWTIQLIDPNPPSDLGDQDVVDENEGSLRK